MRLAQKAFQLIKLNFGHALNQKQKEEKIRKHNITVLSRFEIIHKAGAGSLILNWNIIL